VLATTSQASAQIQGHMILSLPLPGRQDDFSPKLIAIDFEGKLATA
jgi:hypothetical protein